MKMLNILLIEANPESAKHIQQLIQNIEQFRSSLTIAGSLQNGINALAEKRFDIILLDIPSADISGEDSFLNLQKYSRDIPIVLVSESANENEALQLLNEGAQDYLYTSQLNVPLLEKTIQHSIERNKLRKSLRNEIIQRNSAYDQLLESEQKYHLLFDRMLNGFALHEIICDEFGKPIDYRFLEVNSAFGRMTQLDIHAITGKSVKEIMPQIEEYWIKTYGEIALTGKPIQFNQYSHVLDKYFNISAFSPQPMRFATIFEDITDEVKAKIQIEKLSRINRVLSNINQLIVREKDIDIIFKEACSIAVNDGKFLMAWVGIRNEITNKLDVVASAGNANDYLEKINIDFNDPVRSSGPTGRAVTTGIHQYVTDVESDLSLIPWKSDAIRSGYKSSAAFPLKHKGKTIGAITFYAVEKNFFTADELALLDELSSDISFAIEVLEMEKERNTYFEYLKQSEHRYRELFDANPHPMWVYDTETLKFLAVNDTAVEKYGYSREEFLNMTIKDIRPEEDVEMLIKHMKENDKSQISIAGQWRHRLRDGKVIDVEITSHALLFGAKPARLVSANDITEEKRAKEALVESEKRFRSVVEEAVEIIFTVDTKGFISYVNPIGIKISGYSADELKKLRYVDLALEEHQPAITRYYLRQWKNRTQQTTTEYPIRTKSGEIKWLNQNVRLILENGEPKGFYVISRDVTERKKTEQALIESEEKFRAIFQNNAAATAIIEADTTISLVNEAFCRISGYTKREILGVKWPNFISENDRQRLVELNQLRLKGVKDLPDTYEFNFIKKGGENRTGLISVSPMQSLNRFVISFIDITDLLQTRLDLEESRREFQNYFDSSSVGLSVTNTNGEWIEVNQRLCGILGYEKEEMIGKPWTAFSHPDDNQPNLILFHQTLDGKIDRYEMDKRFIRKDGSIVYINLTAVCQRNSDGSVRHVLASYNDITSRKHAEEALKNKMQELEQFNDLMVGREIKMLELKKEINQLLNQHGKKEKYIIQ